MLAYDYEIYILYIYIYRVKKEKMKECMRVRVSTYCEFVTCHTRACCIYILLTSDYIRIFLKSSFWIRSPRGRFSYVPFMAKRYQERVIFQGLNVYEIRCEGCLHAWISCMYLSPEKGAREKNSHMERLLRTSCVKFITFLSAVGLNPTQIGR